MINKNAKAPELTAEEFDVFLREANRYKWISENMGLAILFLAEATNADTFHRQQPTPEQSQQWLARRIDHEMVVS